MIKKLDEVMFLFGAGISIPINIPAMAGIYRAYMDKKQSTISSRDKKTCEFFTQEMGINQDLEEFLLAANNILQFKSSNLKYFVERTISRNKETARVKDFNRNLNLKLKDVRSVKNGILKFLSDTCFKFDRDKTMKINSGFVETLSKKGYCIYSTNYDFAFEYVAIEKQIQISDNFVKKGQRQIWNDKIEFNGENSLKLIKLHGSVTWYKDDKGTIERIHYPTNINPVGKKVENIVIVPTRFKDIYDQHFFALYSHYLSSLAKAKIIIIAGHSLRDDYLRAAIIERQRQGNFQIVIIDPSYPNEIKKELPPARLGSMGNILHIPYKWEEIADELSQILLTSESKDIAKNLLNIYKKHQRIKNKVKIKGSIRKLVYGETKTINVDLEAYLVQNKKPSNLRVWLEANYKDTNGKVLNKVNTNFIELYEKKYGDKLTGLIDESVSIEIKVPNIPIWRERNATVTLNVGIVSSNANSPANTNSRTVVAKDEKTINYT